MKNKNIHVLPTDKPSRLHLIENALTITSEYKNSVCDSEVNIYITNDEEIKDCWCLNTHTNDVYFLKGFYGIQLITKKIIITTDQDLIKDGVQKIDDEFLEWFVKNPSCEEVEVIEQELNTDYRSDWKQKFYYKIIIPSEEPKQETLTYTESAKKEERIFNYRMMKQAENAKPAKETLEEAAENYAVQFLLEDEQEMDSVNRKQAFKAGAKWQQERMYSKEDMRLAIKKARDISDGKDCFDAEDISGCTEVCTYSWRFNMSEDSIIEQFKKK